MFNKPGKNDFDEPTETIASTISIKGVFHETTSYLKEYATSGSTIQEKSSPMILCLRESAQLLTKEYVLEYNGKTYTIGSIKNLAESNCFCDISLEEILHA